jgi:hypothetical protein
LIAREFLDSVEEVKSEQSVCKAVGCVVSTAQFCLEVISMDRDPILKGLLIIVALLLALNLAVSLSAVPSSQAAGTFQYKTVDYRIEGGEQTTPMDHIQEVLNQQGQEGWELVQIEPPSLLIFKRSS